MSAGTERLEQASPLCFTFEGTVRAVRERSGRRALVLDRSAFYPESGGQPADRGSLGALEVDDVQLDDDGAVLHFVRDAASLPEPGATLAGRVDARRRRLHMALHTGQHLLSRALLDEAAAPTASSRLGESGCTIDVAVGSLDEAAVERAERLVNAVIDDDLAVRVLYPTPDELAALPLRRPPKVRENVRVVAIGEVDYSPCGGTHCTSTAQVGTVRVTGLERYKGMQRVSFDAGARARDRLLRESDALRGLARRLTCGALAAPAAVDKLARELAELRDAATALREQLARRLAAELLAASTEPAAPVLFELPGDDVALLRALGAALNEAAPERAAVLAARVPEGWQVLCARGARSTMDCGALLKRLAARAGGRGGGRPDRAEGRLPRGPSWEALAAAALAEG